jgi:hypothetical protein
VCNRPRKETGSKLFRSTITVQSKIVCQICILAGKVNRHNIVQY